MKRHSLRTILLRFGLALLLLGATTYALGGTRAFTSMRTRIRRMMEPPTAQQMQRAETIAATQAAVDSAVKADRATRPVDGPASLGFIIGATAVALGFVVLVLVVSAL